MVCSMLTYPKGYQFHSMHMVVPACYTSYCSVYYLVRLNEITYTNYLVSLPIQI